MSDFHYHSQRFDNDNISVISFFWGGGVPFFVTVTPDVYLNGDST